MKNIRLNVAGVPNDYPQISDDYGHVWKGIFSGPIDGPNRICFPIDDFAVGQGHITGDGYQDFRFLFPANPGNYEGPDVGLDPLIYTKAGTNKTRLTTSHEQFRLDGKVWWWKGATEFNAPARMRAGENIDPLLEQRKSAGATILRSLFMGYPFRGNDQQPLDEAWLRRYLDKVGSFGLYLEGTVFAGTRTVCTSRECQLAYWEMVLRVAEDYPFLLLELLNEDGHSTQSIDPQIFRQPPSHILSSHGSGLQDSPAVSPFWSYVTYHPRRDAPPDGRGFENNFPYGFQSDFPKGRPFVADEGLKPNGYGSNPFWAEMVGRAGRAGAGVTYHTDAGINGWLWTPTEYDLAVIVYNAIEKGYIQ